MCAKHKTHTKWSSDAENFFALAPLFSPALITAALSVPPHSLQPNYCHPEKCALHSSALMSLLCFKGFSPLF